MCMNFIIKAFLLQKSQIYEQNNQTKNYSEMLLLYKCFTMYRPFLFFFADKCFLGGGFGHTCYLFYLK